MRYTKTRDGRKTVIIVGGGFGGLNAAKSLSNIGDFNVLLFDRRNHHLFQPLLYQVATAGLNPGDIAVPIRSQFKRSRNIEVHLGRVDRVDLSERVVYADGNEIEYDYLILACGAQHSYFNHPEWEEFAPGLKTLEQATEIRRRILTAFESAENEGVESVKEALTTFVVVGGGPTGVELAGAIADISRTVLHRDFKRIDPKRARVVLVEAGPRVLAAFDPALSVRAGDDLHDLGVELRVNARVDLIDAEGVSVGGVRIPTKSVFWAAGVQASKIEIVGGEVEYDRAGRIAVTSDLSLMGHSEVFVIGDMAAFREENGEYLPGLAPVAMQAGNFAAECIINDTEKEPRGKFKYLDKGTMATIGKNRAIAQISRLHLTGRIAWLAWLFVHIFLLIGFKNRLSVMFQWAWSYIFSKRGARLITERDWRLVGQASKDPSAAARARPP